MNNLVEDRFCEPKAWEVLELTARYYNKDSSKPKQEVVTLHAKIAKTSGES